MFYVSEFSFIKVLMKILSKHTKPIKDFSENIFCFYFIVFIDKKNGKWKNKFSKFRDTNIEHP